VIRRLLVGGLVVLVLGVGVVAHFALRRPDLSGWHARLDLPAGRCDRGNDAAPCVEVTWLGVASLVFDDGRTVLLTDGFFSRPGLSAVLGGRPVGPDLDAIEKGLRRAGVERAAAVMTVHSHYDHAMDAPEVARRTGAQLLGSHSTALIGEGAGLPASQRVEVEVDRPYVFGDFRVVFHRSRHVPLPGGRGAIGSSLETPLVPPAPLEAYVEGGSYTIEIGHAAGVALVQGSAGYVEGELEGVRADVVLLGVGGLDRQEDAYRNAYYRELVDRVGARRVVPIHWDDFTRAPGVVEPFPVVLGDLEKVLSELAARSEAAGGAELRLLPAWKPVVLLTR